MFWHRLLLAAFFVCAGVMHFIKPAFYVAIVPPYLPRPKTLVLLSGVFEILGGIGVLFPPLQNAAGIGLIALLVAVFPANIFMAQSHIQKLGLDGPAWLLLMRLPLQSLLIWWVRWCTKA